jgi:hypothetical protein
VLTIHLSVPVLQICSHEIQFNVSAVHIPALRIVLDSRQMSCQINGSVRFNTGSVIHMRLNLQDIGASSGSEFLMELLFRPNGKT